MSVLEKSLFVFATLLFVVCLGLTTDPRSAAIRAAALPSGTACLALLGVLYLLLLKPPDRETLLRWAARLGSDRGAAPLTFRTVSRYAMP